MFESETHYFYYSKQEIHINISDLCNNEVIKGFTYWQHSIIDVNRYPRNIVLYLYS